MPSMISFVEDKPIIGNVAKRHLAKTPELVLFDLKHLRDIKRELTRFPYSDGYSWSFGLCIEEKESSFVFQSKETYKRYSTIEIYQILLQKIKQDASEYQSDLNEGEDVDHAVITVPDYDNKLMIEDIFGAAESARLKIIDIITEIHADLLYFLSNGEFLKGETVAVVDIGGGTGFIEKFSFEKGFHEKIDLSFFCGKEINQKLEDHLGFVFDKSFNIRKKFNLEQKLEIEKVKEDFSFEEKLSLPSTFIQNEDVVLTRSWFEERVMDKLFSPEQPEVIKSLQHEDYSLNILKVFLVGGTCRIPYIQELFKRMFGKSKVVTPNNLQEITATGALIHGLKVLNGEHGPVLEREWVEKQLDLSDSVNEPVDNKVGIDSFMNTQNEPLNSSALKDEKDVEMYFELLQLDERTNDSHKPQLPPK